MVVLVGIIISCPDVVNVELLHAVVPVVAVIVIAVSFLPREALQLFIVKLNFSRIWGGVSRRDSIFIFIFGNAFKVQMYFLIRA